MTALVSAPTVIWSPQEGPQSALLECPVFEVFYGGARGGGKTEASIGDWIQHSTLYGADAIGIFVRRKLTQLTEVIARTKQLFTKLGGKYNEQQKTWTMANGARLKFVYLERDSDAEEYQGHSYTRIYVEEVTNFPMPGPIDKLRATLRSGAGVPVGMRLTGNPGGPGHNWVKKRYIDPCKAGYKIITEECEVEIDGYKRMVSLDRVFIPSKLGDNMLLMRNDPTYVLRLRQSGSEQLVKAWLEGNWDIVDGAFFEEFSELQHVKPSSYINHATPQTIRFRSFDWGSAKPFSVGWYAICDGLWPAFDPFPAGALFKYREWYGAKGPNVGLKLSAAEVQNGVIINGTKISEGILDMEAGERIRYAVADPSIFIRNGGPSIAESMMRCKWRKADNKRLPGWEAMHHRLRGENNIPMLYFADCCEDSIRTIPSLQHDENNAEDLDTDAEDHAADETRYAVMSRPWRPAPPIITTPQIGQILDRQQLRAFTINEMVQKAAMRRQSMEL
jgi:hypothetical protein